MKKRNVLIMLLILILSATPVLTGCGGSGSESDSAAEETAQDTAAQDTAEESGQSADTSGTQSSGLSETPEIPEIDYAALGGEEGVDVDLTVLSMTMVYSVVYDMMTRPNEYIGKIVKMTGIMNVYHLEETGKTYYACVIMDATACCAQGIEFETVPEITPDQYPDNGELVTVKGTFAQYDDDGAKYCVLKDAVLE